MNTETLLGSTVRLEPLAAGHAEALLPSASDPDVWRWMPRQRPETTAQMHDMLGGMIADTTRRCFAVRRLADGAVIGSTSLYDLDTKQGRAEVGTTWFDRSCWGGPYNAESKLLLFGHAFDDLGVVRLALRTDHLNVRSQRAMERLGLVYEGTLRSHMRRPDGSRRDSVYYSLLADEWPAARERLADRVAAKTAPLG
ncbi:GNAT family N-acetyltransferase [Streptomyces sp. NPDC060198]|uniref:GNAT family N-acetyltransferase n=1 Tax=Streptomyces sp. NPDC060198 TaxID=3347070 RepID=UPI003652A119